MRLIAKIAGSCMDRSYEAYCDGHERRSRAWSYCSGRLARVACRTDRGVQAFIETGWGF